MGLRQCDFLLQLSCIFQISQQTSFANLSRLDLFPLYSPRVMIVWIWGCDFLLQLSCIFQIAQQTSFANLSRLDLFPPIFPQSNDSLNMGLRLPAAAILHFPNCPTNQKGKLKQETLPPQPDKRRASFAGLTGGLPIALSLSVRLALEIL